VIAGLTWDELDRLVDEDPIGLRDRAWTEIQELRAENQRLRSDLTEYALRVTMGGPAVPVDTGWGNLDLPAPASASDPSAPPIRTGRGSDRLSKPNPARRLTLEESQALTRERHGGAIEKLGRS
jgi:hypothetical protein